MIEVKCSRNRPGTHWPVRPLDVLEDGHYHGQFIDDASRMEYFMPMRWLDHVPIERAVNEVGLFGNQNTVCRPRAAKWRSTVERLKTAFPKGRNRSPGVKPRS